MRLGIHVFLFCSVVLAVVAAGCSTTDPEHTPDYRYPLAIGNVWEYARVFTVEPSDSLSAVPPDTVYSHCTVEVVGLDTLSARADAYVLREAVVQDSTCNYELERYYRDDEDGLYLLAYEPGATFVSPKPQARTWVLFNGMCFSSVKAITSYVTGATRCSGGRPDSLFCEDPPVRTLEYPLLVGSIWSYREAGNPWRIDKKVTAVREVDVPAGRFTCYVVEWFIDLDDDGTWDDIEFIDYISAQGLVRRWVLFPDMTTIGPEGDTLGLSHATDDSQLTDLSLE